MLLTFPRKTVSLLLAALLLAACQSEAPTAEALPVAAVKQLATVVIPPTLSQAERLATRAANASPTPPPPTPTATETPYIGIFLGEANPDGNLPPIIAVPPPLIAEEVANGGGGVACPIAIDAAFGEGWRTNPAVARNLGCPIQERFGFAGNVQVFERGVMYRRAETNEVWAVRPGNIQAGKYWYVGQPPTISASGLAAPEGRRVPSDTFGAVWLSNAEISDGLGFAITPEQVADLNIQRYEGGTLFLDVTVGQVFVLLVNGDAYGPY